MEELSEALKAVERELNLSKKAYNAVLYLYWAAAFPMLYLLSLVISSIAGISINLLRVLLSTVAILLFIFEEAGSYRKVRQIERALGREGGGKTHILLIQVLVWPVVIVIATMATSDAWLFSLWTIGAGMLSLALVDCIFEGGNAFQKALIGLIILAFSIPYWRGQGAGGAYATLVLSSGFALGAYITLRKAMRE